jgi:hypothetical protein
MKRILLLSLLILLSFCSGLKAAGDSTSKITLSFDPERPLEERFFNGALTAELALHCRVSKMFGFCITPGYGYYQADTVFKNVMNYTSRGFYLRLGPEFYSEDQSFRVGLNFGKTVAKEKGTYQIAGPYWGDLFGDLRKKSAQYFSEFSVSYEIFRQRALSIRIGGSQVWRFIGKDKEGYKPLYVPGAGIPDSWNLYFNFVISYDLL